MTENPDFGATDLSLEHLPPEVRERIRDEQAAARKAETMRLERQQNAMNDVLANAERAQQQALEAEERRRRLPCYAPTEAGDDDAAVDACASAKAHEGCEFATWIDKCPRKRAEEQYGTVFHRLKVGDVEARESEVILHAVRVDHRLSFFDTDALRLVRAVLKRKQSRVSFMNAAEVRGGEIVPGHALLTGTEVLVGVCGQKGVGKTLAACYAIAREGGLYTVAGMYSRPSPEIDMTAAKKVPVLVIDQLGRENIGDSAYTLSRIEEILDARYAGRRLTFLVGNIGWQQGADTDKPGFVDRYDSILADRFDGDGVFVLFSGESMRGQLRAMAVDHG